MELHVVIRDANVPAGNTTQPTHPVAWRCVCVCHTRPVLCAGQHRGCICSLSVCCPGKNLSGSFLQTSKRGNGRRREKEYGMVSEEIRDREK